MPHPTSRARKTPPPPPGVGLPWIVSIFVLALVAGLAAYEAGATVVSSILAGLLALPVVGGGAYAYRRRRRGAGPPAMLVTLVAALGVGVPTVGMASCMSGCTAATQQRVVSATAAAARAADSALAVAFEVAAAEAADRVLADMPDADGDARWAAWCEAIAPTWEVLARIECGVVALAGLARTGQGLIDAAAARLDDETGGVAAAAWARWAAPAASLLAAVMASWTAAAGAAPQELAQVWALLEAFAGPSHDLSETCHVGPPPGCPNAVAP
jgi:hypothetical protein